MVSLNGLSMGSLNGKAYRLQLITASSPAVTAPPARFFTHIICRFFFLRRAGRPQVLQNIIDMRKRLKGIPTSGTVSIVVTDIEDFSGVCWRA